MDYDSLNGLAKAAQERTSNKMIMATTPHFVRVLNKKIIVLPRVFSPQPDTVLLIKSAKVKNTDKIFEPFAGTGAISILLANKAAMTIAADINPESIKNINRNVKIHNLENKIRTIRANIFPKGNLKFDVIIANPPYTDNKAKNIVQRAFWDENHKTLELFFRKARKYLTENGKIYCSWSNFADFNFFEKLVKDKGFTLRCISKTAESWHVFKVYEIKPVKDNGN